MSTTPRLSLPLLAAGQAQKHVTHNDALMRLDALVHLAVASRIQGVPPAAPAEGAAFIVPAGGSGVFTGRAGQVAFFEDGGWAFLAPRPGWQAWVADESAICVWAGAEWRAAAAGTGAAVWGVNATADSTTRLAVAADASLFGHAGTDHRMKLNKHEAGDTASLVFQTGFSGRAEMGLSGDDQFRIKVSANGTAWTEALAVDRTTGAVTLPASPWAREAPRRNLIVNGEWRVNQRGFGGGMLAAGAFGFDRWKAQGAAASLSRSGSLLTLASGTVQQMVEPALWSLETFAALPLVLSVEDLSGGALTVTLGSASGTITPGSGRRGVSLTPAAGASGPLPVKLSPASGSVSFRRIKLEIGAAASPWEQRDLASETQLCMRYHWRPGIDYLLDTYQAAGAYAQQFVLFPSTMRATPTASYTVPFESNISGAERWIGTESPSGAVISLRAAALGRAYAHFTEIAFDAEL